MFFNFNVLFPITPFSRNFYGVKSVQCPVSTQGVVRIYPEGAYVTIGNPAICLFLSIGLHFRDELQYGCDVSQQKIKYRPIRTRENGGVTLSDVPYAPNYRLMAVH